MRGEGNGNDGCMIELFYGCCSILWPLGSFYTPSCAYFLMYWPSPPKKKRGGVYKSEDVTLNSVVCVACKNQRREKISSASSTFNVRSV